LLIKTVEESGVIMREIRDLEDQVCISSGVAFVCDILGIQCSCAGWIGSQSRNRNCNWHKYDKRQLTVVFVPVSVSPTTEDFPCFNCCRLCRLFTGNLNLSCRCSDFLCWLLSC